MGGLAVWGAGLLLGLTLIAQVSAQSTPVVPYPRDYKSGLVKYAVVDRSDGLSRDLYVSPDALDALKRNPALKEFPVGALFASAAHQEAAGRMVRSKDERILHLMQRIQAGPGSQSWAFGGFDPVTTEPLPLQLPGDCLLCHQAALGSDMAFSMSLLKRFAATGAVQYGYCSQPGRQACVFPP